MPLIFQYIKKYLIKLKYKKNFSKNKKYYNINVKLFKNRK